MDKIVKKILIVLSLQYVLGMYTAMFAARPEDPEFLTEPVINKIIFGLHGLTGLGLLIGSSLLLYIGLKNKDKIKRNFSIYGFISVLVAFIAGVSNVVLKDEAAEVASFMMSLGFLGSFLTYGILLLKLTLHSKSK